MRAREKNVIVLSVLFCFRGLVGVDGAIWFLHADVGGDWCIVWFTGGITRSTYMCMFERSISEVDGGGQTTEVLYGTGGRIGKPTIAPPGG